MKSTISFSGLVLFLLFIAMALFAAPAFAQENVNFEDMGFEYEVDEYEVVQTETRPPETDEYGTQDFIYLWIPACQFQQHFTDTTQRLGTFSGVPGAALYTGRASNSGPWFTTSINLPTGAYIYDIRLYYYDNDSTYNINGWYWRHNTGSKAVTQIRAFSTTGTPGFGTYGFDPYPYDLHQNYDTFIYRIELECTGSTLGFRGLRVKYKRIISLPPTTATFSDVPTNHGFFRNIEALAASGITTGFSDGTYRPNDYVTRGQMAAFLSRALGLHFKDSQ